MKQQIEALIALAKEACDDTTKSRSTLIVELVKHGGEPAALLPILELALRGLEHSAGVSGDASGAAEAAALGADPLNMALAYARKGETGADNASEKDPENRFFRGLSCGYEDVASYIEDVLMIHPLTALVKGTSPAAVAGRQQGAESGEDTKRLDWLILQIEAVPWKPFWYASNEDYLHKARIAIDAAIKGTSHDR